MCVCVCAMSHGLHAFGRVTKRVGHPSTVEKHIPGVNWDGGQLALGNGAHKKCCFTPFSKGERFRRKAWTNGGCAMFASALRTVQRNSSGVCRKVRKVREVRFWLARQEPARPRPAATGHLDIALRLSSVGTNFPSAA